MTRDYSFGNVSTDEVAGERGWFVGHFMREQDPLRHSSELELKWGRHAAGEKRSEWVLSKEATSISVLVRGLFQISFADADVLLSKEGDYVIWGPGVAHTWIAEEDSIIMTLRWPSKPGDSVAVRDPRAITTASSTLPPEQARAPKLSSARSLDTDG